MADSYATYEKSFEGTRRDTPSRHASFVLLQAEEASEKSDKGYQSESENDETEESDDDEGPSILPPSLMPFKATTPSKTTSSSTPKTAEEWCENYMNNFEKNKSGHSSVNQSSHTYKSSEGWSEEYEVSMTSIGAEEEGADDYNWEDEAPSHFHLSLSSDADIYPTSNNKAPTSSNPQNDDSLSQIIPPPNHPLAKRRCSHAADPLSSWSDLTTSLHPNADCVVPRRGSVTSWGGLNLSASTGASLNPYGFSNHRRGSIASSRSRSRSPIPRSTGRRYSMTPSFAAVNESVAESVSEFDEWMDSDLSSILYMEPKELLAR